MESSGTRKARLTRALRSRNYRLFFAGQGISLIGTWMQQVAMSWLVYRLTFSPFLLGVIGFSSQVPLFLVAPFAGVLADRWNRHRVLIMAQTVAMLLALALAILTLTGHIAVWHLVLLAVCTGIVNAVDIPVRQSFVVEMLEDKEDLSNAIGLNSSLFNSARLIGPSLAGVLVPLVGEGVCFLINAISYVAVIAALRAMRVTPRATKPAHGQVLQNLREGFSYAFGFPPIRALLLLVALVSLVGTPYTVILPVFAKEVLGGDSKTLGFLLSASGVGALAAAIHLASRRSVLGLDRRIGGAVAVFGAGLMLVSLTHSLWPALLLMAVVGCGMVLQMTATNTILQTLVDDDKRGRVMSIWTMSFSGAAPFGSLLAGTLATHLGVPMTLRLGGALCLAGAGVYALRLPALREMARPVYVRLGILPKK